MQCNGRYEMNVNDIKRVSNLQKGRNFLHKMNWFNIGLNFWVLEEYEESRNLQKQNGNSRIIDAKDLHHINKSGDCHCQHKAKKIHQIHI